MAYQPKISPETSLLLSSWSRLKPLLLHLFLLLLASFFSSLKQERQRYFEKSLADLIDLSALVARTASTCASSMVFSGFENADHRVLDRLELDRSLAGTAGECESINTFNIKELCQLIIIFISLIIVN